MKKSFKKFLKILLIILIFICIIMMAKIKGNFNFFKKDIIKIYENSFFYNLSNKLLNNSDIQISNESNNIIFDDVAKIKIDLKRFEKANDYTIQILLNENDVYNESIDKEKEVDIQLLYEGKNKIKIIVLENDKIIDEETKEFFYIKSYTKQFLDEKEQNGTIVHYLNGQWERYENTFELLKNLGAKNIRTTFSWDDIEISNNNFNFDYYDKWIKKMEENNINIIASFNRTNKYTGNDKIINSEDEKNHFLNFTNIIKKRYSNIKDFQLINEPNLNGYIEENSIKWYSKILSELGENTIVGGIATPQSEDTNNKITCKKFYDNLFQNNKNFNNLAVHIYDVEKYHYENIRLKAVLKNTIEDFNKYGGFNNLYITEYGVHNTENYVTEEEQATRLIKQSIIFDRANAKKIIQYNFWDVGTDRKNSEHNYGLITNDYLPKKSYYSMKSFYLNTNGAEYIGQINIATGIEAHVYDKDGKPKIIAWATDTNKPVTIDYLGFKASDLYGKEIENTNGKLEITTSPVYIDNVSTKNFYQAISNSITTGYKEFDEKFANEINKVPELKTKISNLNTFAESLKNVNTLDENIANSKMKEHFSLGNTIIKAYDDGRLDIEYVKLSSILDYLNTTGNAYEDLITVSAKTRISDLTSITNEVNEAKSIIENDTDIDIVYPNKIYKFSKDLLDTSSYVLGLDEENDIKTGLINSKATHAKYLADWSEEFSKIYIKGWLQGKVNSIKDENSKVYSKNEQLKSNTKISTKYNSLIENLNNLPSQTTSITKDIINSIYNQQYELINTIVDEFNNKKLNISESEYQTLVTELLNISEQYKELFNTYITEDDIQNSTIENNINNVIDRYNENKDIDMTMCAELINNIKQIYNDKIQTEETSYNYLNKRRIQNTCTIISKMLENKIKKIAQQEAQKIGIAYNIDPSTLTNKDVIAQIKLPNSKSSIESNPNNEKYTFTENGTKNITINIRGYKYNYNIKITNIDKTPPQITGIEQGGKYKESITPQITDENLSEVKLIKDGQEVENYKQNTSITQEGIYQLKATDKAGNETSINFVIAYPEDEKYKIENNTIKNIKGETSVETLKGKLQVDEKYTIKRKDTEIQNSDNIATGDILETESGNKYTLIVRGDLNKDGSVDIKDLVKMRRYLLLGNSLDESEVMAADTNLDGKEISIKDLVKMRIILLTQ